MKEVGEAKTEVKVWDIINRGRKRRRRVNKETGKEEWKEHFMELLGGVEEKVLSGGERRVKEEGEENEEDVTREEVKKVIMKLRDGKATGIDGSAK